MKEATDRILCNAADLKIHDLKVLVGANGDNVAGESYIRKDNDSQIIGYGKKSKTERITKNYLFRYLKFTE